jgi:hypothetical protein
MLRAAKATEEVSVKIVKHVQQVLTKHGRKISTHHANLQLALYAWFFATLAGSHFIPSCSGSLSIPLP